MTRKPHFMTKFQFQLVSPMQIEPGDMIACFKHDDTWENRTARVTHVEVESKPGALEVTETNGTVSRYPYAYQVWFTCRHMNARKPEVEGGPPFVWHRYPWNQVARITPRERGLIEEAHELREEGWVRI